MKIEGEHIFDGPREEVWKLVRDPEVLASALPGTQSMKQISETEYEGKMNVRVGPVAGVFSGRLVVSDEVPPESYSLSVEGRGAPGFAEGIGSVLLVDQGDNTTLLKYQGELQIGGKLAGVGQRLMDSVSKSIIRQGLDSMNQALKTHLAPEPEPKAPEGEPEPAPAAQKTYQPPSETQFAASVAKDVVKDLTSDLFSPENQSIWATGLVALIAVIVGFWLGRCGCRD